MASGVRQAKISFVITLVCAVVASIGLGAAVYLQVRNEHAQAAFAVELRDGLVTNCERNGNPLRKAVQSILYEQIRRSRATPPRFFPDIPPAVFERLVREQVKANRAAIERIEPVDCAASYPKP